VATSTKTSVGTKSWLTDFMRRVEELEESGDFLEPRGNAPDDPGEVETPDEKTEEKVLGYMTPRMQALYTLWQMAEEEILRAGMELSLSRTSEAAAKHHDQLHKVALELPVLRQLFWLEVKAHFPTPHESGGVGVRKGFAVVERPGGSSNPLFNLIQDLANELGIVP